jgi:hypothetical protein
MWTLENMLTREQLLETMFNEPCVNRSLSSSIEKALHVAGYSEVKEEQYFSHSRIYRRQNAEWEQVFIDHPKSAFHFNYSTHSPQMADMWREYRVMIACGKLCGRICGGLLLAGSLGGACFGYSLDGVLAVDRTFYTFASGVAGLIASVLVSLPVTEFNPMINSEEFFKKMANYSDAKVGVAAIRHIMDV